MDNEQLIAQLTSMSTDIKYIKVGLDRLFDTPTRLCVLEDESKRKKVRDRILFGGVIAISGKILWDICLLAIAII